MVEESKLVCTLPIVDMADQLADWGRLRDSAVEAVALHNGAALLFPSDMETTVYELAASEAECCAFLRIDVAIVGDMVRLEITTDEPGGEQVIAALIGQPA